MPFPHIRIEDIGTSTDKGQICSKVCFYEGCSSLCIPALVLSSCLPAPKSPWHSDRGATLLLGLEQLTGIFRMSFPPFSFSLTHKMPFMCGGSINILSDQSIWVFFLLQQERGRIYPPTLSGHTDEMQPKLNATEHPSHHVGPPLTQTL